MRLSRFLPQPVRTYLLDSYWNRYWQNEEIKEEHNLGIRSEAPIRGSERAELIEKIAGCYPFNSILEVGCGYAQNFHVLGKQFPAVRLAGVDLDPERVVHGQEHLRKEGVTQALLAVGNVCDLSAFPDRSADIVVSCALLLFVAPAQIENAVSEMLRVARKSVLLLEQHQEDAANPSQALGVFVPKDTGRSDYYLRDYRRLFGRFVPVDKIREHRVPKPRWRLEQWQRYAYVFRIDV